MLRRTHGVACAATGVLAATLAPILWYFLLTLRLRNAFFVAVFDFFIYNFVLLLGSGMTVRAPSQAPRSAPGPAPHLLRPPTSARTTSSC